MRKIKSNIITRKAEINGIKYCLDSGVAIIIKQDEMLSGDIVIPETVSYNGTDYAVATVENAAFMRSEIRSIALPESVTNIGEQCFKECFNLQTAILPGGITALPAQCFYGCSSLESIILPDNLTELGNSCFGYCVSLASIALPISINRIGDGCFTLCCSLSSVTCKWHSLDAIVAANGAFIEIPEETELNIPAGTAETYKAKEPWSKFWKFRSGD